MLTLAVVGLSLVACQGTAADDPASGPAPSDTVIEVTTAGKVSARVTQTLPCRATLGDLEMIVGTAPLVAQVGEVTWTGELASNGTTFLRNTERIARLYVASADEAALIDPQGIAITRITRDGTRFAITDRTSAILRYVRPGAKPKTIEVVPDHGDPTVVTGTDDLILAAVLTATEASAEVRGLAACHRLFPIEKAP